MTRLDRLHRIASLTTATTNPVWAELDRQERWEAQMRWLRDTILAGHAEKVDP